MRPTVLLFDIDGTLVTTAGAGRRAMDQAFEVRFHRGDACNHFRMDGMTDRAIARAGLQAIGQPGSEEQIEELIAEYLRILEVEVERADPAQYRMHNGIEDALNR